MKTTNRLLAMILSLVLILCNLPTVFSEETVKQTSKLLRDFETTDTCADVTDSSAYITAGTVDSGTVFGRWVQVVQDSRISNSIGSTVTIPFAQGGTDLTIADELWLYVDAGGFLAQDPELKFSFTEKMNNREWKFGVREGCGVLLQQESTWTLVKADSGNAVKLPAGYQGYVRIPLDEASLVKMTRATAYTISKKAVTGMDITITTLPITYESRICFDNIGIMGEKVNGGDLPVALVQGEKPVFIDAPESITVQKNTASNVLDFSAGSMDSYLRYYCSVKPVHGNVSVSPMAGIAYYIPNDNYVGTDSFSITVINGQFERSTVTCSVAVMKETGDAKQPANATKMEGNSVERDGNIPNALEQSLTPWVTDMGIEGYVQERLNGNIENWLLTVQEDYPQLIELIDRNDVDGVLDVSAVCVDVENMNEYGIFDYDVEEYSSDLGRAIAITHNLVSPEYRSIEIRFSADASGVTDISNADSIWMYADISDYSEKDVPIGFGFLDVISLGDGSYGSGETTTWVLKKGAQVYLYDNGGEKSTVTTKDAVGGARATLPAGFKGWIEMPLNTDTFVRSVYGSTAPETITGNLVSTYRFTIEGNDTTIGKTAYLASFGVSSNSGKQPLPVNGNSDRKFTETFSVDRISTSTNKVDDYEIFPWYGEFAGKILTGMAYMYRVDNNEKLLKAGNKFADALLNAQNDDGYIGIYTGMGVMGGNGSNWDLWNHYHAIYGLYQWYQISGSEKYLNGAIAAADFVYRWFSGNNKQYSSAGSQSMNLAISHGFAILYKETKNEKYLNAAKSIVLTEWPQNGDWMNSILSGKEYYQSALPRWEALHSVMTLGILYEVTGEEQYYKAITEIFWSVVKTDRHNTGGFSTGEQASGDPFATGAIETCCTVAYMALGSEVLRLSADSSVADELELSYFNAMLGSLVQENEFSTYNTPMEGERNPGYTIVAGSAEYPAVMCCQANLSRGLGEISQWALLTGKDSMYLNYYGRSAIVAQTPGGNAITVSQETGYPVDGKIVITLHMEQTETFGLYLRIPAWAKNAKITFGGNTVSANAGNYYCLKETFQDGDVIEIDMDIPVHYWIGENACAGKCSVYYGPILLALDENFMVGSVNATSVFTTDDIQKGNAISGDEYGCILLFDTTDSAGNGVRLVDFSSAGKNGSTYYSWLPISHNMDWLDFSASGDPVWNNAEEKEPAVTLGDVDNDGKINAKDALIVLKIAVNKHQPTKEEIIASDVTKEGKINAVDALQILKYAVNKITSFD